MENGSPVLPILCAWLFVSLRFAGILRHSRLRDAGGEIKRNTYFSRSINATDMYTVCRLASASHFFYCAAHALFHILSCHYFDKRQRTDVADTYDLFTQTKHA